MRRLRELLVDMSVIALILGIAAYGVVTSLPEKKAVTVLPNLLKYGQHPTNPHFFPVVHLDRDGEVHCTAFVIDANYAATAAHCLTEDYKSISNHKFTIRNKELTVNMQVRPVGVFFRTDIGLVSGDFNEFLALPLNTNDPAVTMVSPIPYISLGYALGQKQLAGTPFIYRGQDTFFLTGIGILSPGMSGGPTIDSETGIVIGINSSVNDHDDGGQGRANLSPMFGFLGAFNID